jgi:hypothetical protein
MICKYMCMIELNFEEQIENKLEVNSNRKNVTRNATSNSTGRNFLIRGWNSEFYPLLERLQNYLGLWYSRFPQDPFGSGIKVQNYPDSSICPELTPPPNFSDHTSWTVGRRRVYLCFLERYQIYLSLLYCELFLIRHRVQSAEFCVIIICPNQNLWLRFLHLCTAFQRS